MIDPLTPAYRLRPEYSYQKSMAVGFWNGECAVCQRELHYPPAGHHFVIPKNYTRNRDRTVDWWWNVAPVDQDCHPAAHGMRDELILRLCYRIAETNLVTPIWGMKWLKEQVEMENFKIYISFPVLTP